MLSGSSGSGRCPPAECLTAGARGRPARLTRRLGLTGLSLLALRRLSGLRRLLGGLLRVLLGRRPLLVSARSAGLLAIRRLHGRRLLTIVRLPIRRLLVRRRALSAVSPILTLTLRRTQWGALGRTLTLALVMRVRRTLLVRRVLLIRLILRLGLERRLLSRLLRRLRLSCTRDRRGGSGGCGRRWRGSSGRRARLSSGLRRRSCDTRRGRTGLGPGFRLGVAAGRRGDVKDGIDVGWDGLNFRAELVFDPVEIVSVLNLHGQLRCPSRTFEHIDADRGMKSLR